MSLKKFRKNNKGIETRVLIYVLAAIALMAAIMIVTKVNEQAGNMVQNALSQAGKSFQGSSEACEGIQCSVDDCPTNCCTPTEDAEGKITSCAAKSFG